MPTLNAARDLDGRVIGPAAPEQRATAVVVFASWCQPCRKELAVLGELVAAESRLRVIGVNYYEEFNDLSDETKLRAFLGEAAPWLQVVRADEALFNALGRPAKIPTLFLFDHRGKLVQSYLRSQRAPPTRAELEKALESLLVRS